VVFCDGHVESPTLKFLFEDTSDAALARWKSLRTATMISLLTELGNSWGCHSTKISPLPGLATTRDYLPAFQRWVGFISGSEPLNCHFLTNFT
jgi:hypothetical protein